MAAAPLLHTRHHRLPSQGRPSSPAAVHLLLAALPLVSLSLLRLRWSGSR